ncbi:MAG: hypothetical protein ACYTHK_06460 [Planctomycetota bacterium]|jgi:hypothetical protein
MSEAPVEPLELLRRVRRCASDQRKILLALYGLLLLLPLSLFVIGCGRAVVFGGFGTQVAATFMRPVQATGELFLGAWQDANWAVIGGVLLGIWVAGLLVGSFFGMAVTRMAAVELTSDRRSDLKEALDFARNHWHWGFFTPAGLLFGAIALVGVAGGLFFLGRILEILLVFAAPAALLLVIGAVVLIMGLFAGGILAWPTIATEWSDAFDAITRVYGYSFAHAPRVAAYRIGVFLLMIGAIFLRGLRACIVLGLLALALRIGLGHETAGNLIDGMMLEPPQGLPLPQTLAAWALAACVSVFLSLQVARLAVLRSALYQAMYLLLRRHIDRVPMDNIDGYRPDDSAFDPTAQGFVLTEVEEELRTEG